VTDVADASAEHVARRLNAEWATRYRPPHHTLFLGAFSPHDEKGFSYAPGEVSREAALLLAALESPRRKSSEAVHAEFQRAGFFLTHILEWPARGRRRSAGGR